MIGEKVREMAQICGGKVVDMIGSGYNRDVLPYAWFALISGLANFSVPIEEPVHVPAPRGGETSWNETKEMIQETKKMLRDYWTCLAG
jgi:acetoin utilization deacetylase AcuC-like enzyme